MAFPFCSLDPASKRAENDHAIAFADSFPVSEGHTLIAPKKHVSSIYELHLDEQSAVWALVAEVRQRLLEELKPDAFNIGVNDGLNAGQTIEHTLMFTSSRDVKAMCLIQGAASDG